jgi:AcrR family transcriptional regulator
LFTAMPRPALSEVDVDRFRQTLCDAATRLFAEHGYSGVTLRALAAELGCSPMTPYRYFDNKEAIFDAVRQASFERFADAQARAASTPGDPIDRLRSLARAYARFALEEPHAYRIMFELDPPDASAPEFPPPAEHRSWTVMRNVVVEAVESGALDGDADTLAHLFWSGTHGLVSLHLAGKLQLGRSLEDLLEPFLDREIGHSSHPRVVTTMETQQ